MATFGVVQLQQNVFRIRSIVRKRSNVIIEGGAFIIRV